MDEEISFTFRSGHGRRYEVFDEFAAGGVATLHLARYVSQSGVAKVVAVKRLHRHHAKDPGLRGALLDEARVIARIQHPNVVSVLDVCEEGDDLFIAMEYVHGVSLARLLKATAPRPLDPGIAAAVVADALKGLHAAHEACSPDGRRLELVHRDVSPQNIIVGADGVTRVIDFGLAYALGRANATQSGVVKGKPSYMSPEQVRGERVTRTSDIFSAGSVLWGALTGRKLFDGDVIEATLSQVLLGPIRKPSEFVPDVPAALEAATMRALSRSPAARFQTAIVMARALEKACPQPMMGAIAEWVEKTGAEDLAEMSVRVREVEASTSARESEGTLRTLKPLDTRSLVPSAAKKEAVVESLPTAGTTDAHVEDEVAAAADVSSARKPSVSRWIVTAGLVLAAASIGWFAANLRAASPPPAPEVPNAALADERPGEVAATSSTTPEPPASVHAPAATHAPHTVGARPAVRHPTKPPPTSGPTRPVKPCNDLLDPKCK